MAINLSGLRVLFLGSTPLSGRHAIPDSMGEHVAATLSSMGADVDYYAYRDGYIGGLNINRCFEALRTDFGFIPTTPADRNVIKIARRSRPDLVLTLLGNYTPPVLFEELRRVTNAPMVVWCQDHIGTIGRQYIVGAQFDHIFAKDTHMIEMFAKYTRCKNVHYLPEACNPRVHTSEGLTNNELLAHACDVTTAATIYYYRAEHLSVLADFDLRIWGTIPRYYRGPLLRHHAGRSIQLREKAACFRGAKIVLNTLHPQEVHGLNARAFECAGCGGFQLINNSVAVTRHFVPEKEIIVFDNLDDLVDKVRYYVDREAERREIADAGMRRAHSEHTYERRLDQMTATVFS